MADVIVVKEEVDWGMIWWSCEQIGLEVWVSEAL
jgi:hypothetical protein